MWLTIETIPLLHVFPSDKTFTETDLALSLTDSHTALSTFLGASTLTSACSTFSPVKHQRVVFL